MTDTPAPLPSDGAAPWWARLRSRRGARQMPQRVRQAIEDQEDRSEILIGWFQLALIAVFGTFYLVAPRAEGDPMAGFRPVPFALAAYLVFTLARMWLAYRRLLPIWFLLVSIAVDIGLLIGLIWSFHLQYEQPAAFYLKVPTFLYLFIFIALRALRFDPRFVFAAGCGAALGWIVLVGYAAWDYGMEPPVTRDFVEYLTSNTLMVGAEVDKLLSIAAVTVILTVALMRARALLVSAVTDAAAARDLSRFFSPEIARTITGADTAIAAGDGEVRDAAVLMIDIRGFSRHSARVEPSETIRLLADYQTRTVPEIERHGGTIDKFLGDGIMATFGATTPSRTAAADALMAMESVLLAGQAWNAERMVRGIPALPINAAAVAGPLVFGAVGHERRLEYTVIGATVNLAARLEKFNKAMGTDGVTTRETHAAARSQGFTPRLTTLESPGRTVPDAGELDLTGFRVPRPQQTETAGALQPASAVDLPQGGGHAA